MNGTYRRKFREAMASPVETRTSRNCVRAGIPTANLAMTYQGGAKARSSHLGLFLVGQPLRRRHAPNIQQFVTPAQFELWKLKEWFRSAARTLAISDKCVRDRA